MVKRFLFALVLISCFCGINLSAAMMNKPDAVSEATTRLKTIISSPIFVVPDSPKIKNLLELLKGPANLQGFFNAVKQIYPVTKDLFDSITSEDYKKLSHEHFILLIRLHISLGHNAKCVLIGGWNHFFETLPSSLHDKYKCVVAKNFSEHN